MLKKGPGSPREKSAKKYLHYRVVGFFQEGGMFMYPIVIVLTLGLAISIERYLFLSKASVSNRMVWKKITPFIKAGKFKEAVSVTSKSQSAIGQILTYGLDRIKSTARRDDIEKAME
ncbi:MAG: hypothetical protein QGG54_22275, partial [Gammaproteobacteria bacterium]|nr:hypothetical protein [Gammaproteobacteria bacterium]